MTSLKRIFTNRLISITVRIMELEDFIQKFANQFDDTDASEIKADTKFHELGEWSSMLVLALIAMANIEYDVTLTGQDVKDAETVEDLFNLIKVKLK